MFIGLCLQLLKKPAARELLLWYCKIPVTASAQICTAAALRC